MLTSFRFHSARRGGQQVSFTKDDLLSDILQNRLYVWCNKDHLTWNSYLEIVLSSECFSGKSCDSEVSWAGNCRNRLVFLIFLRLQAIWNLLYWSNTGGRQPVITEFGTPQYLSWLGVLDSLAYFENDPKHKYFNSGSGSLQIHHISAKPHCWFLLLIVIHDMNWNLINYGCAVLQHAQ